jgi:spermidine synthase
MISPSSAKLALKRSKHVGTTIGAVYAWGTVGSIVGTLSTGFFLISALTANGVVLAAAVLMALVGWTVGPQRLFLVVWVAVLAPMVLCASLDGDAMNRDFREFAEKLGLRMNTEGRFFSKESDYQYIKVYEEQRGSMVRKLVLDHLVHGYVDMANPGHLEYDYEKVYADVAKRYAEGKPTVSAFFLGGGSFTFQRWTQHIWPDAHVEVAEIDPMVVEANHEALGLSRDTSIQIHIGDARNVVDSLPVDAKFDFFFGDAFNDFSVPWHLTTLEFNRKIAAHLTPDGAYLMNVIDDYRSGQFLGACYVTLRKVFPYVYIFCTERTGVNDRRDTFVVAASQQPIDITDWLPDHFTDFEGSVLTPKDLNDLEKKCGGRVLTDELAPVENLLAPVVRTRDN